MQDKLSPAAFFTLLEQSGVGYYAGVPDSLLSSFGWYLQDHVGDRHDIAVNEGQAVGLAIGYHVATGGLPLVYMQNSGLGNAVNPLVSLADPLVMGIPMLLLIGWRGQPGHPDEPQHTKQGLVTRTMLDGLDVPHIVLGPHHAADQVRHAAEFARSKVAPFAIVVPEGVFDAYAPISKTQSTHAMSRERAVQVIADMLPQNGVIVSTTGKASRELFEYRETLGHGHERDLLIVGGMGHASAIAQSVAKYRPDKQIVVIDGDGALLMHMGSLVYNGANSQANLWHVVINNGVHESVGGQPTVIDRADISAIAKACGYKHVFCAVSEDELVQVLTAARRLKGPVFIEAKVTTDSRQDLMRPSIHPMQNKRAFMQFLDEDS